MWWTLHDVPLAELWARIRQVRAWPFLGAVVLATLMFPLRTVRWRYLLRFEGVTLPYVPLWHATAIGFMANNLLPARAGELARAYTASKVTPVRFSTAFASIAVERVLDGLTLVAFLAVAIWAGGFSAETMIGGVPLIEIARGAALLFAAALVAALLLVHWPRPALALTGKLTRRLLPLHWSQRMVNTLEGLLGGLDALKSPGRLTLTAFWSVVVWGVAAASFWLAFAAFDVVAPWSAALMLQGLIALGVALPSSPAFFGPFEAAIRVSFALYGLDATSAASYALTYHVATFVPITLLGMWSLGRAHVHLGELARTGGTGAQRHRGTQ